ncbi:phage antirepressor KilAC domain-containing protein [Proteus mirabilis]|uniref:phage antirepressor KilAC domain-containing protein n=1 Tax=Proteus mirabilis TaxID=584 RepID=UPI0025774A80|nr:DNA-binding protein [Proteus mirabilis]MDM3553423.1 phage antirepressor KilAC domain-containing protein [Proteus mirabilis]
MMQKIMEVSVLPIMNRELTMSSREIASLTGSNHSDVKRSADRLFVAQILTQPLAEFPFEHNGNQYTEYRFNKRDSLVLVARLSPQFTAKIVDRWQELESKMQPVIPQTLPEALRLAADLAEEKQKLESELAIAIPKAQFVDNYVLSHGSMTFRQVCKLLQAKETDFRCFLIDKKIMYRLNNTFTPYQTHVDLGRFEIKTGTNQKNNHAFAQSRFTTKGVKWIAGLWAEYKVEDEI